MTETLKSRKQEFARDAIFEAAMDLFVRKGFQETSVEDVSIGAGVSLRSFFRYFTTKDHLLGHNIVRHGNILVSAVAACPAESSAKEVVRDTVLAGLRFSTSHPRTRQIIAITALNLSARRAHKSRIVDVEIRLAEAFAARTRSETKDDIRPRLLANLTLMVGDLALAAWFKGEIEDCSQASDYVFALLSRVLCEPNELRISPAPKIRKAKSPAI
jgi:AcrR family transcriptional regulator